jgi:general stress protein 26
VFLLRAGLIFGQSLLMLHFPCSSLSGKFYMIVAGTKELLMNSNKPDLVRLAEMIKDIKITMMTTADKDGRMYSRPMATQKIKEDEFDGRLWFFTKKDSPKVHSIENDQHVNLAYAKSEDQHYISITGKASLSQDKAKMKELWHPMLKAWFPEGLDDPQISLIEVQVETAELWDSPPSKVVQLAGLAKSFVTGQAYNSQAHSEHIDLQHPRQ